MTITVRNVDEVLYKEFKLAAAQRDQAVGEALGRAMRLYLSDKPKGNRLLDLPHWDWGPGTEDISQNIDEIAYGDPR